MGKSSQHLIVSAVFVTGILGGPTQQALAQDVIADDLIVQGSLCVGPDCVAEEEFSFDTLRLKSADPVLQFLDTSNAGTFPANDWSIGIANSGNEAAPQFYLRDDSGDAIVLLLQSGESGGVAMGQGATLEAGAISVGSDGGERRVVHVAEGTDPTDAATKSQLDAFISSLDGTVLTELDSNRAALDQEITELESELAGLTSRLEALESALGN